MNLTKPGLVIAGLLAVAMVPLGIQAQAGDGAPTRTMAADGSPLPGFDPASTPQTSLEEAAAKPLPERARADDLPQTGEQAPGRARLVDGSVGLNPDAKGVNDGSKKAGRTGKPAKPAKPKDVLQPLSNRGGCLPDYGRQGQCLPAVPPSHAQHADHDMTSAWTCAEVRAGFPQGIALTKRGVDPLNLDRDGNGIACSPRD
jgi:hypothetical protein